MTEFINKLIAWYMKKTNRCFFSYDENEFLVLRRTDNKSVFYDLHGQKFTAFKRVK